MEELINHRKVETEPETIDPVQIFHHPSEQKLFKKFPIQQDGVTSMDCWNFLQTNTSKNRDSMKLFCEFCKSNGEKP